MEQIPARASTSSSGQGGESADLKEVLADVGKMLKAMSATTIKTVRVLEDQSLPKEDTVVKRAMESFVEDQAETGLLDSGASHPMRPADADEYRKGQPVRVTLAGEDVRVLRSERSRNHTGSRRTEPHTAYRAFGCGYRKPRLHAALEPAQPTPFTPYKEAPPGQDQEPLP